MRKKEISVAEASATTTNKHPWNTCYSKQRTECDGGILTVSFCYEDISWTKIKKSAISDSFRYLYNFFKRCNIGFWCKIQDVWMVIKLKKTPCFSLASWRHPFSCEGISFYFIVFGLFLFLPSGTLRPRNDVSFHIYKQNSWTQTQIGNYRDMLYINDIWHNYF